MARTTILITAIGSTTGLSVLKGLQLARSSKFRILGTDTNPRDHIAGSAFCNATYTIPRNTHKNYIPTLLRICKQEKVRFLIPIVDFEIEVVAKHASAFAKIGTVVCASSYTTVRNCNDKYLTYTALAAKGILTPPVFLQSHLSEVQRTTRPPYFVKPRDGCSSIDNFTIRTFAELKTFLRGRKNFIIQPFLRGKKYAIDVLNDVHGKNLVAIPRWEMESKSGIGVKAKILRSPTLQVYSKRIAEALGIKGVANLEVLIDKGKISFIEINPRFSAGSISSMVAGVNLAALTLRVFSKGRVAKSHLQWKDNIIMTRYWQEVFFRNGKVFKKSQTP